jgi:hypothetical protein
MSKKKFLISEDSSIEKLSRKLIYTADSFGFSDIEKQQLLEISEYILDQLKSVKEKGFFADYSKCIVSTEGKVITISGKLRSTMGPIERTVLSI